ncbi:MAG: glycosyltransferase family 39 protein [Chloroflexi bacterium]|nr:glycosyltransferase family 39 protein [Chloroflexota bacterium]
MLSLRSMFRNHLHFIVVVGLLLIVMTWPTIVYVFDTESFWLPTNNRDVWISIWNAWYGARAIGGAADLYFTNSLFHPSGVSLAFHNFSVPHMFVFGILQSLVPASNAYNLTYLLIILANALSAYVYVLYLLKERWLALLAAVVFSFHPYVIFHSNQPDLGLIATVPLAIYLWHRGCDERKWSFCALCGIVLGFTAFVGLYVFVCLLLSLGIFVLYLAISQWRKRFFWLSVTLMLVLAGTIASMRLYPMLQDSAGLRSAIDKNKGRESRTDLLSYFINARHPLSIPAMLIEQGVADPEVFPFAQGNKLQWSYASYLGYLPLVLIAGGFGKRRSRRKMAVWLVWIIPFLILRLGGDLRINDQLVHNVQLPKHYLDILFPPIFGTFHTTDHFMVGVLLPLAVLACYGLRAILESINRRYHCYFVLLCAAWIAFEYYMPPESTVIHDKELEFISWLRAQDEPDSIHVINLPMGRRQSKIYGFHQSISGFPHAEGLAARTPALAYEQYIVPNMILDSWNRRMSVRCTVVNFDRYLSAADQLLSDGFSHIVLHARERFADLVADSFAEIPVAYRDDFVSIFTVRDLRDRCQDLVERYHNKLPELRDFLLSWVNQPRADVSLIYLYPAYDYRNEARGYYDNAVSEWRELTHIVHDEQGAAVVMAGPANSVDLDSIATRNNIFWVIYNAQFSDPRSRSQFATWMVQNLRFCQQIYRGEDLAVEYYIDRDYPCELVVTEDPLELRYDNGIALANLLTDLDAKQLSIDLWWQRDNIRGYAYTIQVFREGGEKQLQIDQVIGSRPLSRATFDTSGLEPGDYIAKLIVYESQSGQSQRGTILSAQQTVERELEIARFSIPN